MSEVVQDAVAEKLEVSGLWRRAKARWLEVMQSPELTEPQRLWIRQAQGALSGTDCASAGTGKAGYCRDK